LLSVWDRRTFDAKITLYPPNGDLLHNAVADPRAHAVYAVGQEGRIWWFDLESGVVREIYHAGIANPGAIALSPDGAELIVAGAEGKVGTLSLGDNLSTTLLGSRTKRYISSLATGTYQGGRVIAGVPEQDSVVQVWLPGQHDPTIISSKSKVTSLGLANNILAIGDAGGNVSLHDLSGSVPVRTIEGVRSEISAIAFDGSTDRIATATADGKIRVLDFSTGEPLLEFQATPRRILSMQFSLAGDTLMTAGEDHATRIWPIYRDVGELVRGATARLPKAIDRR
jgi:WD40 repeat protein